MVIYGQGQNCKVTLSGGELVIEYHFIVFLMQNVAEFPFQRSRNIQATSRKSSTPVRNAEQTHVPKTGGQNDTETELDDVANHSQNYNNTIISTSVIHCRTYSWTLIL